MKTLLLLAALAFLFVHPALADTNDEVRQLVRDKARLERKIVPVFAKSGLADDPEYKKASAAALAASREFTRVRRDHPQLKPFFEASDAASRKMVDAQRSGDAEAKKAAMSELTRVRMDLERESAKIPELDELRSKAQAANAASEKLRRELLAQSDEGRALLEELEALDVRIKALREADDK